MPENLRALDNPLSEPSHSHDVITFIADVRMAEAQIVTTRTDAAQLVTVNSIAEYQCAKAILKAIFTDKTDLEPDEALDSFFQTRSIARYFLFIHRRRVIGAGLARINPAVRDAMYIPYAAIFEPDRGKIPYWTMRQLFVDFMRETGVRRILVDVEDPPRVLQHNVYPERDDGTVKDFCEKRLRWFQRGLGATFIDDNMIPYQRPASDAPETIQAYDLLGIVPIEDTNSGWSEYLNPDRTMIQIDFYQQLYIELMQLEYGDETDVPTPTRLMETYPAIREFLERLAIHRQSTSWVRLRLQK